jgi:hypothetical protein
MFLVFDWYIRLSCLEKSCNLSDSTASLGEHYVHYDDVPEEESEEHGQTITWMVVIFLCWLSATMTLLIVWLIDLRPKASSFVLMIRNACLMQICMDVGYFLLQFYMALGLIDPTQGHSPQPYLANVLLVVSSYFAVMGDMGTVLWTNVICYVFVLLANNVSQNKEGIDIGKDLWKYTIAIIIFASITAIFDIIICMIPSVDDNTGIPYDFSHCPIVTLRCAVVTCSIAANIVSTIYVKRTIADMEDGMAKEKLDELSNRMFFYPIFVAGTRIAYLICGFHQSHFGVNFAGGEEEDLQPINFFNTINYLLWLPAGTGFAIFYLYTHPDEFNYFLEMCRCNKDAHFLPNEIWELLVRWYLYLCNGYHFQHNKDRDGSVDEIRFESDFISIDDIQSLKNRESRVASRLTTLSTGSNNSKGTKNPILNAKGSIPEQGRESNNTRESQAEQLHYLAHTIVRIDSVSSITDSDYDSRNNQSYHERSTTNLVDDLLNKQRESDDTQSKKDDEYDRNSEPPTARLKNKDGKLPGRSFSADDVNVAKRRLYLKHMKPSRYHKKVFIDTTDSESAIFDHFMTEQRESIIRRSQRLEGSFVSVSRIDNEGYTNVEMAVTAKKPTAQEDVIEL